MNHKTELLSPHLLFFRLENSIMLLVLVLSWKLLSG